MLKYSIIVAVYNRTGEVKELLESAEKLDFEREMFEFLFVDDGSKDGFQQFIENYKSPTGLQTRAIYQENKGPGEARNNGMQNAKGEYFIFVDSDCMFPPHWLRTIDQELQQNNYEAFGGPNTHIKTTWVKFAHTFLLPSCTSGSQLRCHGIGNGL